MNKKEKERSKKSKLGRLVLCIVLSFFILVICSNSVFASENNSVNVEINGQKLNSNAFIDSNSGTSLVPFRTIFETLGANVKWDQQTQTIIANKGNTLIRLKINDNYMFVNNTPKDIKIRPIIISGHTFVPLRVVSETLGADVNWDGNTRTVYISSVDNVNTNSNANSNVNNSNSNSISSTNSSNVASTGHPKMPIYKGGQGLIGYHDTITGENSYIKSNNENTTQTTELPSNNSNGNTIIDTRPVEERMSAFINNNYYVLGVNDNNLIFKIGGSGHDLWNRFLPNEQEELVSRIYKNIKSQNLNRYKNFKDNDTINVIINNDIDKQINEFQITW